MPSAAAITLSVQLLQPLPQVACSPRTHYPKAETSTAHACSVLVLKHCLSRHRTQQILLWSTYQRQVSHRLPVSNVVWISARPRQPSSIVSGRHRQEDSQSANFMARFFLSGTMTASANDNPAHICLVHVPDPYKTSVICCRSIMEFSAWSLEIR